MSNPIRLPDKIPVVPEPRESGIRKAFNIFAAIAGVFGLGLDMEGTHPYVGIALMSLATLYGGWELLTSPVLLQKIRVYVRVPLVIVLGGGLLWVSWPHLAEIFSPSKHSKSPTVAQTQPQPQGTTTEHFPTADEIAKDVAKTLAQPATPRSTPTPPPDFGFHEEFPPKQYIIYFCGRPMNVAREVLEHKWTFAVIDGEKPLEIYREGNDIYIDAKAYDPNGNIVLEIEKSTIKNQLPLGWDVNYRPDNTAIEVVDAEGNPVFQMLHDHPGSLKLNVKWYGKHGSFIGMRGPMKPLFKYPFFKHKYEYAEP